MNPQSRSSRALNGVIAVALLSITFGSALAQEEAQEESRERRLGTARFTAEFWVAQPTGLEFWPASKIDPTNPFATEVIEIDYGTEASPRYVFDWEMPNNWGNVVVTLFKQTAEQDLALSTPAEFNFGESLTYQSLAGVNNDGRADAFSATTDVRLRDVRVDYKRSAFRSPRVVVDWFVGWRRTQFNRSMAVTYLALAPDLPPIIPPACGICPDLTPLPDAASIRSSYEGRGISIGTDLEFPLWKNKFVVEAGLSIGIQRGTIQSSYGATNSAFLLDCTGSALPSDTCQAFPGTALLLLGPPYDQFNESFVQGGSTVYVSDSISQQQFGIGLQAKSVSATTDVIDGYIGFRWRAMKWIEVIGGFRQTSYSDVGLDLRPDVNGRNFDQVSRSATYEGFYGGVTLRLY